MGSRDGSRFKGSKPQYDFNKMREAAHEHFESIRAAAEEFVAEHPGWTVKADRVQVQAVLDVVFSKASRPGASYSSRIISETEADTLADAMKVLMEPYKDLTHRMVLVGTYVRFTIRVSDVERFRTRGK